MNFAKFPSGLRTFYNPRSLNYYVQWYFGNVCNANCSYCLNAHTLKRYHRNMTYAETARTVDFINSVPRVYHVTMIGGEPACFDHCLWAANAIEKPLVNILTNGLDGDFIREFMKLGRFGRTVMVCLSIHYELYLADPTGYMAAVNRVIDAVNGNPFVKLEATILLDGKRTLDYVEPITWLVDNRVDRGFVVNVSYVRRTYDAGEFVRSYAVINQLPMRIQAFVRQRLRAERLDILKPNPFGGQPCRMFGHYLYIDIDGTLRSSDCPQAVSTTASIFDDNFVLNDHVVECVCRQPHAKNNSSCELTHGILK